MPDQIDTAIANQRVAVKMLNIDITIAGTGRRCAIQIPADMGVGELLELLSFLPVGIASELQKQRNPAKRILLPGVPLPNVKS